jgi:hypothetical protein
MSDRPLPGGRDRPDSYGVDYETMVRYVATQVAPLVAHVNEHDAWHLAQLQAQDNAYKAARRAAVSQILSALSVLAAAAAVIAPHLAR